MIGTGVESQHVPYVWPLVKRFLIKAFELDDVLPESVLLELLKREKQLWLIADADEIIGAAITFIEVRNKKKLLNIAYLGGKRFKEWQHLLSILEDWGKSLDCDTIQIYARKGFVRLLKDFRFVETTEWGEHLIKEL